MLKTAKDWTLNLMLVALFCVCIIGALIGVNQWLQALKGVLGL